LSRAGAPGGARRSLPVGGALEPLVLVVSVLDGGRAAALLACLADPLRPAALGLLARFERMGRAERHAALARVFGQRGSGAVNAAGIPGALGAQVRALLAPGGGPATAPGPGAMERWARRLALELGVLERDGRRGIPTVLPPIRPARPGGAHGDDSPPGVRAARSGPVRPSCP
jgi:hypothetical protein